MKILQRLLLVVMFIVFLAIFFTVVIPCLYWLFTGDSLIARFEDIFWDYESRIKGY